MPDTSTYGVPVNPVRGLVLAQDAKGRSLSTVDLERWIRLNRVVYKADKIDVLWHGCDLARFEALQPGARELDVALSLRTDCTTQPPAAAALRRAGPWDILLSPHHPEEPLFHGWLKAASEAELAIRVQFCAPFERGLDVAATVERLAGTGVVSVNLAAHDPLSRVAPARGSTPAEVSIAQMNSLAAAIDGRGIEVHLVWLPFCVAAADDRKSVLNDRQFFRDHSQYLREPFELACRLYRRHPYRTRIILLILLEQATSTHSPIDRIILPWIMDHPWVRARVWALHKILRHRKKGTPQPRPDDSEEALEREAERTVEARRAAMGPVCAECSLHRICDGLTPGLKRALPGIGIVAQTGDAPVNPFQFAGGRQRYYDAIDAARRDAQAGDPRLIEKANAIVSSQPPDREIDAYDYRVEGTWSKPAPGCLRWFSFSKSEKLSTPLGRFDPPFTLSVTFGGGIAEFIGFSLGRGCRLVCPMIAYTHRLTLHVEEGGRYVLLRDGTPIKPVEFVGAHYAPARLGTGLEPRISIWNIDGTIGTQAVYIWQKGTVIETAAADIAFSVVTVSTRYARRLQACLESLAHQEGVELRRIEAIVAYVPSLDATAEVLESINLAHPDLHVVPTAFAEEHANAKGLMLNECLSKTRGEWVLIIDADILLAPDMLARMGGLPDDCLFAVPDGRKMLDRETTARVLLGEVRPWERWQDLLRCPGEYRLREADGVPLGYCQCVRRACLDKVQYEEMHHFEGADWKFGKDMRETFGVETRLSGVPVLHLNHGGSNWYGAPRHF